MNEEDSDPSWAPEEKQSTTGACGRRGQGSSGVFASGAFGGGPGPMKQVGWGWGVPVHPQVPGWGQPQP